jgi:hypothetical protein
MKSGRRRGRGYRGRDRRCCRGLAGRGWLDCRRARLLLEDRVVAQAVSLRLLAIVAVRMGLVTLEEKEEEH